MGKTKGQSYDFQIKASSKLIGVGSIHQATSRGHDKHYSDFKRCDFIPERVTLKLLYSNIKVSW